MKRIFIATHDDATDTYRLYIAREPERPTSAACRDFIFVEHNQSSARMLEVARQFEEMVRRETRHD